MILISSTRTLSPPPLPIDTDPILNYRHIQPAAAAAAVGPWLCSHHTSNNAPSSRHPSLPSPTAGSSVALHPHQHHPPFTTLSSKHPLPSHSPDTHPPLSDSSSASPSSTLSIHLLATPATSGSTPLFNPQSIPNLLSSSPPTTMLPNPISDDDSSNPSLKPSNASLATAAATPQQFDSHPSSLSLYDLPTSSSAPPTSSSSFPSSIPSHQQQSTYTTSSSHPNLDSNHHQFYHPSPPAHHSPLHPNQPQHSLDQRSHPNLFLAHQPYHSRPQSAPHATTQVPLDPQILAAAANVEVKKWDEENTFYYQIIHKGVAVGRVKGSGLVNGTKLLNLSGISRGKRDGILKNEKIRKVVKHGTMHLKGVWIAYDRACTLAEQYGIADKVFPLLVLNLEQYVHIEQPLIGASSKLGPNSLFHHHRGHPRLLPQPIKFPPAGIHLGPSTAGSFSSPGTWSAGSSSGRPIDYGEPFSAPPVARDPGVSSVYEQAQYDYLNTTNNQSNPDLLERRHTIPNSFNGYHPIAPFGSPQPPVGYPFQYTPSQLGGYPPRSSASDSTTSCQLDYPAKNHLDSITNRNNPPGSFPPVFHSQSSSTRPPSTAGTHTSPALHSAPLMLGEVPQSANEFRLENGASGTHVKEEVEEESVGAEDQRFRNVHDCASEHEKNTKPTNFQEPGVGSSGSINSPFPTWHVAQGGMMNATVSDHHRGRENSPGERMVEESALSSSAQGSEGPRSNAVPSDVALVNNTEFNGRSVSRSSNSDYQQSLGPSHESQDSGFHLNSNNLNHPRANTANPSHHHW